MKQEAEFLLNVWREACRHIEIAESTVTIAELLTHRMPLKSLLVRQIDPRTRVVSTVGEYANSHLKESPPQHLSERLELACFVGRERTCSEDRGRQCSRRVARVVPHPIGEDALVGPLQRGDDLIGVLIVVPHDRVHATEEILVQNLLEPFTGALENDRRLRELKMLRAAAEADRRTLLGRLGRDEVDDPIVGSDSGLRHVMERVELVARSDVPVLILGETGTGKEVVSRAIHHRSSLHSGPFIPRSLAAAGAASTSWKIAAKR